MFAKMNYCMGTYIYESINEPIPMKIEYGFFYILGGVDHES